MRRFLATEAGGATLLLAATVLALAWANSPWAEAYTDLWALKAGLDLEHWVVDGLMAVFFLGVGLEVSREARAKDRRTMTVPALAALGGMVVPALIYTAFNAGGPGARGWGIAMATDIAFVLGALALAGSRANPQLRLFLLTVAIVDDIGAILVIAIFYADDVDPRALAAAAILTAALAALRKQRRIWPYAPLGLALWFAVLQSGVHPTIAGVVLGVLIPPAANERLQRALDPWIAWLILPVFALAAAGVRLELSAGPITIGIVVALVVGKAVGVGGTALLARPDGISKGQLAGGATLAGIGFTVALFIAELAFDDPELRNQAVLGVLAGSLIAAAAGAAVFRLVRPLDPGPGEPG